MIGLIQMVMVNLVRARGGDAAVAAVLADAGVEPQRVFRMDTDYRDDECLALLAATQRHFGLSEDALYDAYADAFVTEARQRFPAFFAMARSGRDFLRRQPTIHASLAAGLRDRDKRQQVGDKFAIVEDGDDLKVIYTSPNRLCGLYRALFRRILAEYGDAGELTVDQCREQGDGACVFLLQFQAEQPA